MKQHRLFERFQTTENQVTWQIFKPYYVYVLIDPFTNEVFYVGKGKNRRLEQHQKDVLNGHEDDKLKNQRISKIISQGNNVIDRIIGRYETEEEALAVESTLIKWAYGLENLTNIVHGHYHKEIRDKGNLKIIKGIDVEQKLDPNDKLFTRELESSNDQYAIREKLNYLRNQLLIFNENWEISEPDFFKKKDPAIFIKINEISRLQLMMRSSGTDVVIMNIRAIRQESSANRLFKETYLNKFEVKMLDSSDSYFKLPGWIHNTPHYKNDMAYIIKNILRVFSELNDTPR